MLAAFGALFDDEGTQTALEALVANEGGGAASSDAATVLSFVSFAVHNLRWDLRWDRWHGTPQYQTVLQAVQILRPSPDLPHEAQLRITFVVMIVSGEGG